MSGSSNRILAAVVATLFGALVSFGTGCIPLLVVGAAAGAAGTVAYANGDLTTTANASLDETWHASLAAVKDLELRTEQEKKDGLQGTVVAVGANDTTYKVILDNKGARTTAISIRVNVFGDKEKSEILLAKIRTHLPHGGTE